MFIVYMSIRMQCDVLLVKCIIIIHNHDKRP